MSCIFYMFFIPYYILVLFYLIATDYAAGRIIQNSKGKKRTIFFIVSILSNLGTLFLFKYFNFFTTNIQALANIFHVTLSTTTLMFVLPLGLSFHTFQSMSYIIEVYKKRIKAEKNLGIYTLYVMFFPQLVAGPIERPQQMLHQLHKIHMFNYTNLQEGLTRMLIGFFKKLVIADNCAIIVNQVYAHPQDYTGLPLIIATIAFSLQIYYDFSGYIDIAIGAAKILGITLAENFNHPYLSQSISEFWRKWNITLYSWFRDYIYIPLGGNRVPVIRQGGNIFFVFVLSGLWHGASWTFVTWGAIHGIYMVTAIILGRLKLTKNVSLPFSNLQIKFLKIVFTFTLVSFAWIFFRANTFSDAYYIITHSFQGLGSITYALLDFNFYPVYLYIFKQGGGLGLPIMGMIAVLAALILLQTYEYLSHKQKLDALPAYAKWAVYIGFLLFIMNFEFVSRAPFIYFQF